jgi:transcription factor C subunit 6
MYARPAPSLHHRHRSVPLLRRAERVERLASAPTPLGPDPPVLPTRSGTTDLVVIERTARAAGYNIGAGPLWEMTEDRAWFKEAVRGGGDAHAETQRRPLVYTDVSFAVDWEVLSAE